MYKIVITVITLFFLQACKQKKSKLSVKEVLVLNYGVNSNFGFSKDTIILYSYTGKIDNQNSAYWAYFTTGLYKPYNDSIRKNENFSNSLITNEKTFSKIITKNPVYINNIYSTRFKYDVIADSFNIYPSGGAIADIILKKSNSVSDTSSVKFKFSKRENVQALKSYKSYWVYLTSDTGKQCNTIINILNINSNEKYNIETNFCIGQINFLLYDIMGDERPEIIIFYTPVFLFRDVGTLKIFRILE